MLKQEVFIIIACAFQQHIHILSNNNEPRSFDVTVEVTGAREERANLVVRMERFSIFYTLSPNLSRACVKTNVHW